MGAHKHFGQLEAPTAVGCVAWPSATQAIASATDVAILFDSETFDTHGFHSTSTNTGRLTVPAGMGGLYLISGQIRYTGNATGTRAASFRLTGTFITNTSISNAGTAVTSVATQVLAYLAAGDYVELFAYQTSGSSLNTSISATNLATWFGLARVGV